jgi:hypothetical protein
MLENLVPPMLINKTSHFSACPRLKWFVCTLTAEELADGLLAQLRPVSPARGGVFTVKKQCTLHIRKSGIVQARKDVDVAYGLLVVLVSQRMRVLVHEMSVVVSVVPVIGMMLSGNAISFSGATALTLFCIVAASCGSNSGRFISVFSSNAASFNGGGAPMVPVAAMTESEPAILLHGGNVIHLVIPLR